MDNSILPAQTVLTHCLANGLQAVGQCMPEAESVSLAYYVRTGARDEQGAKLEGISHFLEHMLFKGTEYMNRQQLDQAFTRIGAKRNGFTSLEYTIYYAHVLGEHLERALELLSAMMYPRLLASEFEVEKRVILNEIAHSEDQPQSVAHWRMMRAYFGKHPLGNNVLGSRASIQNLQLEDMRAYWQQRYGAKDIVLSIAGKFVWEQVLQLAERFCGEWQRSQGRRIALPYEPARGSTRVIINPRQRQQLLFLSMPMVARESSEYEAAVLGTSILGRSEGSRLCWSIVHQGLAVSASASLWTFEGTGLLLLSANVLPAKARQVLNVLRSTLEQFLANGPTEDELHRAKSLWVNDLVLSAERPYAQMWALTRDWVSKGRLVPLGEKVARVQAVTKEDVLRVFRGFPLHKKQVLTAYGPLQKKELARVKVLNR